MNIVILAGGTGSIALQSGLYGLLDENIEDVNTKVIVNAYDNGLSTGSVRRVLNGNILGPSDVRKNQTTRLKLEQPKSPWHSFLDIRFTEESSKVKARCYSHIASLGEALKEYPLHSDLYAKDDRVPNITTLLREAVDSYFESPNAVKIDYNDFSLANIIYAGFAKANKNSLRAAARIMAALMGIKDNVLLNDDTSLFLGAVTKSGKRITDEGDIVSWGNTEDPFVAVTFTDTEGNFTKPVLCKEAEDALLDADLIILSSGTQWSSLIPTYETEGFRKAVNLTSAQIIMVMNRQPDKDSPGQSGDDVLQILSRYFPEKSIKVITDSSGHVQMNVLNVEEPAKCVKSIHSFNLESPINGESITKHRAPKLANAVLKTYFSEYSLSADRISQIVFDYDDTLVGRGGKYAKASKFNVSKISALATKLDISVCTGNSIKSVNLLPGQTIDMTSFTSTSTPLSVYADGGLNRYEIIRESNDVNSPVTAKFKECIAPEYMFTDSQVGDIIDLLTKSHISMSKIENRGNLTISIKPIDFEYRQLVLNYIRLVLSEFFDLNVRATGRTTIDISHKKMSKAPAVEQMLKHTLKVVHDLKLSDADTVLYIGDELDEGNDAPVKALESKYRNLKCVSVKNPVETAMFIMALTA